MKKFVVSTFALFCLMAISLSSCKSHEKCPAYSKVEKSTKKSV